MPANYPTLLKPSHSETQIEFILSQQPAMCGRLSRFIPMGAYCLMMEKLGPSGASKSLLLYNATSTVIGCVPVELLMFSPRILDRQADFLDMIKKNYDVDFIKWRRVIRAADTAVQKRLVSLYSLPGDNWNNDAQYSDSALEVEVARSVYDVLGLTTDQIKYEFLKKMGA